MSNYQFSLAYLTIANTPPDEMIYIAARAGYDFFSLRPINMGLSGEPSFTLANNKSLFSKTKQAMENTGLKLLDIELARITDDINPLSYESEFEAAAKLGARHVLSSIWTDHHEVAVTKFAQLCDLAGQYKLTVDLEFVPVASVANLESAMAILEAVKKDNAGLMIDTHHFHRSRDSVKDLQKVPQKMFHFAQICDATGVIPKESDEMIRIMREERIYVGEGGINIADIVNHMPKIPYSIELPNISLIKKLGKEEFARQCLLTAKAYFNTHPREQNSCNLQAIC